MNSPFFNMEEFSCRCHYDDCKESNQFMDERFLEILFKMRAQVDFPFLITSGFRCERHNKNVGGSKNSYHTKGLAADIACSNDYDRYELIEQAIAHGLTVIVYRSFVHVDLRPGLPKLMRGTY